MSHQNGWDTRCDVTNDTANARRDHSGSCCRYWRYAEVQRFACTIHCVGGQSCSIQPFECTFRPPAQRNRPCCDGYDYAEEGGRRRLHPEDRSADEKVPQRTPANGSHEREEASCYEVELLPRSQQRAGCSEDRQPGEVEPGIEGVESQRHGLRSPSQVLVHFGIEFPRTLGWGNRCDRSGPQRELLSVRCSWP